MGLTRIGDVRAVAAGAVQQGLCTVAELAAELSQARRREAGLLRAVLAEVADGIRSPAEADFRDLIRRAGLPAPLFNARLYLGRRLLAVPDAWWPQAGVAAEVDSREWHFAPEGWEETMKRHRRMTAAGVLVLHVSPGQVRDGARRGRRRPHRRASGRAAAPGDHHPPGRRRRPSCRQLTLGGAAGKPGPRGRAIGQRRGAESRAAGYRVRGLPGASGRRLG